MNKEEAKKVLADIYIDRSSVYAVELGEDSVKMYSEKPFNEKTKKRIQLLVNPVPVEFTVCEKPDL
jgi:hypothetical protein